MKRNCRYIKELINRCNYILQYFFFIFLNFIYFNSNAQFTHPKIELSDLYKYEVINKPSVLFMPKETDLAKSYPSVANNFTPYEKYTIPTRLVPLKVVVRFHLVNHSEKETSCYFFPGFFFSNVNLYKVGEDNQITQLPTEAPRLRDSASFRLIRLSAHDSIIVLAECFQVKTYINIPRPRIIQSEYVNAFILETHYSKKGVSIFTFVFCGLLIMMVFYSLANFLLGRSREFLYYAAYAFFLGLMLFTKQYYHHRSNHSNFFFEEYLDFLLQGIGICFYLAFLIRFLDTRKKYPFLHKLYTGGIGFLIITLSLYTFLHYGTDNYFFEEMLENYITKSILLVLIVIFLVYASGKMRNKIFRYLFLGNLLFLIFSLASLLQVLNTNMPRLPGIFGNSVVQYETGLLLELIFFLIALTYKNRMTLIEKVMESERLKLENERKELEKQLAVMAAHQEERERISADMHDELGSGMTTIRLMSEIAKNKMKENVPVEIEKISDNANDLLNKMNAIIWSMNSSNDTLDNLISYIRAYAINYFEGTSIECKINIPVAIPSVEISGDKRRNIFLCLKEILNNSLKHSKASEIKIDITADKIFKLKISDNGIGIDPENNKQFGNGLQNITRRMKNIGGYCTVQNHKGTETTLKLPI